MDADLRQHDAGATTSTSICTPAGMTYAKTTDSPPSTHDRRTWPANAAWRENAGRLAIEHDQPRPFDNPASGMGRENRAAKPYTP